MGKVGWMLIKFNNCLKKLKVMVTKIVYLSTLEFISDINSVKILFTFIHNQNNKKQLRNGSCSSQKA